MALTQMMSSLLLSLSVAATAAGLPTAYLTLMVILATVHTRLNNQAEIRTSEFCGFFLTFSFVTVLLSPVESDALSDGQTQRGMDRYLDSLFDPVLSDSNMVSSDSAADMLPCSV